MPPKIHSAKCKCGAVELAFAADPMANACCFCNGCRLAGDKAIQSGGDGSMGEAGGKHLLIFKHSQISIANGAKNIGCYKHTQGSATRRFYCKKCKSDLAMAPTALPMIAVSAGSFQVEGGWGPIQARHSLKETGGKHDAFMARIKEAPTQVQVVEGLFAPVCSFLCPMICAKTCCCCCNKSTIPEFTGVDPKSVTDITFADGTCDENSTLPRPGEGGSSAPQEVEISR